MPFWMSTLMIELPIKMNNTNIKYFIMKWAVVIKLFLNKYVQKNTFLTEERTECAWCIIENNSKNQKQSFLLELLSWFQARVTSIRTESGPVNIAS